tara:strand:+ start:1480 stop:2499 length:1020 start_codon:yes stop_codon:yes gene_type:complete
MSKKNSNVILKNQFKDFKDLSKVYFNFKKNLNNHKKKSYIIAISGGPDSLALVALSKAYSYEHKKKFFYVLINHNIRKNSKREANKVRNLLKKNNIPLNILSNQIKIKSNIQSQARTIRYKLLLDFCKKKKTKTIITAHNLEDQVETFFIRLSRGSGLTGLSAMKSLTLLNKNTYLFRPLLEVKKTALIKISKLVFGRYIKDPSNFNKKYLRTKIRNLRKPLKDSGINYEQIIKSINNLASSREILDNYYDKIFKSLVEKQRGSIFIQFKKFDDLDNEIKMRVIQDSIKIINQNYYSVRSKKVLNLINSIEAKNFKKATLGGCLFFKKKDHLCLIAEKA